MTIGGADPPLGHQRAAWRSVCPGPTVRTTVLIPSRTCIAHTPVRLCNDCLNLQDERLVPHAMGSRTRHLRVRWRAKSSAVASRRINACRRNAPPPSASGPASSTRRSAIVEREFAADLSLDDIARRVASSRRQLQRAYAEIGNTTFRDHLTAVRMEGAAEMLATRSLTVREVAHRVGYRQPAQFAKAFRRYQGVAPSDFRSPHGREPPLRPRAKRCRSAPAASAAPPCPPARPDSRRARPTFRCRSSPVPIGCRRHGRGEGPMNGSQAGPDRPCWRSASASSRRRSGIALGLLINWFPVAASSQAKPIDTLWDVLLIVSVPIFVMVPTIVLYSVWRFRMRPGEELKTARRSTATRGWRSSGRPRRRSSSWRCAPTPTRSCTTSRRPRPSAMNVRVVGEQFTWTSSTGPAARRSPPPALPARGPADPLHIQSKDVLHDFWVPAFRTRRTPFRDHHAHPRDAQRLGNYPVVCAELCGLGHAVMRADRPRGLARRLQRLADEAAQRRRRGRRRRRRRRRRGARRQDALHQQGLAACASCHTLADASANGTIGPDLDKFLKGKNAAFIQKSIVDPNA